MTAPTVSEKMRSISCRHSLNDGLELESGPPRLRHLPPSSSSGPNNNRWLLNLKLQLWVSRYLGPKHRGSLCQYRKIIVTLLTRRHPRAGTRNCVHCECVRLPLLSGYLPTKHRSIKPSYLLSASVSHLSDRQNWLEFFPCHLPDPRPVVEKHHALSNCW